MPKIVINGCYGGFSVSPAGVRLGRQLSGDPMWGGACLVGDRFESGEAVDRSWGTRDVARHDPVLVQVVEIMGAEASGTAAKLEVVEISGRRYRIDEYDGMETVETPDTMDWVEIPS